MEVIPNSYIARVVLAYLYEEKLNKAAIEFCAASPYLKEERDFVKRGFRPATCISLKLTALFREYGEIQQKLDSFVEKYGVQFDVQHDLPLVRKIDLILSLLKQVRYRRGHLGEEPVVDRKEARRSTGSYKRKRLAPSPHPSLSSSTPEVGEPKQKRICSNSAFIVLNDSGKNFSNLSHISPIGEGISSQDSDKEDDGEEDVPEKAQEEEEQLDVRKFPSIDLFSQTLLENENYPEKIADLINKGLESSMSAQPDAREGTSSVREELVEEVEVINNEPKADGASFNFNFDELISNIVNSAVKDPVFDDMMEDISSKAVQNNDGNEEENLQTVPPSETPIKDRLRKTCRKNYNPCAAKRSVKKVRVISDEPYYGGLPEGVDVEQSQPATMAVVKVESLASGATDLDQPLAETTEIMTIQSEVSSTAEQPITTATTTQFYVIQPDNTTKLVDINQLQFPTQQTGEYNDLEPETASTLIPITGVGIPEHTYYINVPNCYLDPNTQMPVYFNTYPAPGSEHNVNNPAISIQPEVVPSPDKFLIFPSSSSGTNPVTSEVRTTSTLATTVSTSPSTAAINSIYSTFVPLIPKPEVKTTPQNTVIQNIAARCNSTPSRKASHIRILNFHTPAKQSPLVAGNSGRISTPGSAPPSVSSYASRIPIGDIPRLDPIAETIIKIEPRKTPDKVSGDLNSTLQTPACNSNSVSNTPRVSKDPRTCVRVLSRSESEELVEVVPTVEIPAAVVAEVRKKPKTPRIQISEAEMDEWRKIRSVSKSNFDQHLRMMEEKKHTTTTREQFRRKRKKPPTRKAPAAAVSKDASENATPSNVNDSLESVDVADSSLTELHGQMLEDALASAKKSETGKTPGKTPAKAKTPAKEDGNGGTEQGSKIYVKIATPRKKTPVKTSPKRRLSKEQKSTKKRRSSSPRKRVSVKKNEEKPEALEQEKTVKISEEVKVDVKKPDVIVEMEAEPETPAKAQEDSLSQVEATPPEARKPIKDHPKLLAKKSSAEYVRKEQEKAAETASTSVDHESPPEKPLAVAADNSFGSSICLDTPFKGDLSSIPITPRFLMPMQVENTPLVKFSREGMVTSSSLKKTCEILTPNFPITPGLVSTPKSVNSVSPQSLSGTGGFSSRRTDYSSGSSYYKPDESEDLDKNLEAMLHGERKKRTVKENSGKESIEEPQPNVDSVIESTPQKPPDLPNNANASSSDSSESSDSSSDSSTSESSPENTPVKQEPSPAAASSKKPSTPYLTIYEARRQQQAELEAKKQRTIARMKIAKPQPPMKKIERKFSAPPGFKPRKVVITRNKESVPKPTVPANPPRATASASSKRKNPTPRKVVFLDKILPMSTKKHSPKRKSHSQGKSPRSSMMIADNDIHKILTPRKDQAIEGTYESENLSRLCCTPEIPDVDLIPDKKQVYPSKSPARHCNAEDKSQKETTPDSNKENQSLEAVKDSNSMEVEEAGVSGSSDEDEDDAYNDCSFNSFNEESIVRVSYSEKKSSVARCAPSSDVRLIKKCNVVLEDRRVCLQASDLLLIFEQLPSPPISSGTRSSSKKAKISSGEKDLKPEVCVAVSPPVPTIKAKINVISAVRNCAHPMSTARTAEKQKKHHETVVSAKKNKLEKPLKTMHLETAQSVDCGESSEGKLATSSPKMPLKLDMKKKQQQQQPSPSKPATGKTDKEEQAPPPVTAEETVESKEDAPLEGQLQKNIQEDEIDAVLTHIHGS